MLERADFPAVNAVGSVLLRRGVRVKTGKVDLDGLRKANLTVTVKGLNRELIQGDIGRCRVVRGGCSTQTSSRSMRSWIWSLNTWGNAWRKEAWTPRGS